MDANSCEDMNANGWDQSQAGMSMDLDYPGTQRTKPKKSRYISMMPGYGYGYGNSWIQLCTFLDQGHRYKYGYPIRDTLKFLYKVKLFTCNRFLNR